MRSDGVRCLKVKTLAASAAHPSYERTRHFYERTGFLLLETIHPYPGWDEDSPCAIYVKPLDQTSVLYCQFVNPGLIGSVRQCWDNNGVRLDAPDGLRRSIC